MVNIFQLSTEDLKTITLYIDVIEQNGRFPKFFWINADELGTVSHKCRLLTRYCLENYNNLAITDLRKYDLKEIYAMLKKYKLLGMIMQVFNHNVLEILKNAYPEEFSRRILKEWFWSKHGLWEDKNLIVEAVLDMVEEEGIKELSKIPKLDWKQRLLDYGIYNILSVFNWSIFKLFDFVYPDRFKPIDFKYKCKWKLDSKYDNAYNLMHEIFREKKYSHEYISMLGTADFRRLGLAGMIISMFDSSAALAKEFYLFGTVNDSINQKKMTRMAQAARIKKKERSVFKRLSKLSNGKDISNLKDHVTLYKHIKQLADREKLNITQYIRKLGFNYKKSRSDIARYISREELLDHRTQGLTYVQIAKLYGSNPTTISNLYKKHFGGDPLVPSPVEDYITVQELMVKYRVDHKTVMKIVTENNFENHRTITNRYVKISELEPAIEAYIENSKTHQHMISRYSS